MIGWAAATGGVSHRALSPVPHHLLLDATAFWALSLNRTDDYARARVPMLPVVAGAEETRWQILLYSVALVPIGAAPWLLALPMRLWGDGGAGRRADGRVCLARAQRARWQGGERAAQQLFAFSILYLFILFAVLLVEGVVAARWV